MTHPVRGETINVHQCAGGGFLLASEQLGMGDVEEIPGSGRFWQRIWKREVTSNLQRAANVAGGHRYPNGLDLSLSRSKRRLVKIGVVADAVGGSVSHRQIFASCL